MISVTTHHYKILCIQEIWVGLKHLLYALAGAQEHCTFGIALFLVDADFCKNKFKNIQNSTEKINTK